MVGSLCKRLARTLLLVLCLFCVAIGVPAQTPSPPLKTDAPVIFDGRVLFHVYSDLGTLKPAERAHVISQRLQELSADPTFNTSEFHVVEIAGRSEIMVRNTSVATVTEDDAAALKHPRVDIANGYTHLLTAAVDSYRAERTAKHIAEDVARAVLAAVLFIVIILIISRLAVLARRAVRKHHNEQVRSLRYQQLELLSDDRVEQVLLGIINVVHMVAVLALSDWMLTIVLGSFPWTQGYVSILLETVNRQIAGLWDSIASSAPNFINIAIIIAIAYYALKIVKYFLDEVRRGTITIGLVDSEVAAPTYRLAKYLIIAATIVAIFPYIPGAKSRAFEGISVFLGVLVSLGASSAMSNLIAGIVLTYMRPFRIGDRVKIGDTIGDILDRTDLVTRIRTTKNVVVTIPNATLLTTQVINYSSLAQDGGLILNTTIKLEYDIPGEKAQELLIAAARETTYILAEPAPYVHQTALNDFHISYELNAYTRHPNEMTGIYSDLHDNIHKTFDAAGIDITTSQPIRFNSDAKSLPPTSGLIIGASD